MESKSRGSTKIKIPNENAIIIPIPPRYVVGSACIFSKPDGKSKSFLRFPSRRVKKTATADTTNETKNIPKNSIITICIPYPTYVNYTRMNYGIFLAVIIGFLIPWGGQLKFALPYLLGTIIFFSFLQLDFHMKKFIRKELAYFFFANILILPALIFFATKNLSPDLHLGIFLIALAPTAVASPILVNLIHGDRELNIANVVLYNLIAPATYAILLNIYFSTSDIEIPTVAIFMQLFKLIFIPLVIAIIIRKFKKPATALQKTGDKIGHIIWFGSIAITVSAASSELYSLPGATIAIMFAIIVALASISYGTGFMLSDNTKIRRTLAVNHGYKNNALTIWIALANFSPLAAAPTVAYLVTHHIINGILLKKFNGKIKSP